MNPYEAPPGLVNTAQQDATPTRVRWRVLSLSILMAVLLYLDRFALNAMEPVVVKEIKITPTQMGWITSAFFWAYALSQVPAGMLGDRFGGRAMLSLYVAAWSVAFGAQALAQNFSTFLVFRALQGIAQAGAYAVTACYLKQWIEAPRRGFANGSVSMGGRAGGVLTNFGTPLLVAGLGWAMWYLQGADSSVPHGAPWRPIFLVYAALGILWAIVFFAYFRNTPEEHAGVNDAERQLIRAGTTHAEHPQPAEPPPPWWLPLTNRNLWLLSAIMFAVNVGWIFLATKQTAYLSAIFQMPLVQAGSYTAITILGGVVGSISGGFATDILLRRLGPIWGRRLPGVIACGGAATMYGVVSLGLTTPIAVTIAFTCAFFLNDFLLGSLWSTVQDVGGKNSGFMFGFINMSGNLGAAIFAPVIGMLVEAENWQGVFLASGAAFLVALSLWFFVNPKIQVTQAMTPLAP